MWPRIFIINCLFVKKNDISDKHLKNIFLIPSLMLLVGKYFIDEEDLVVRDERA